MNKLISLAAILSFLLSINTYSKDKKEEYQCLTTESSFRQVKSEGKLDFVVHTTKSGIRTINDVNGVIRADWSELSATPSFHDYKGWFNIDSIVENINYNPRKYKNFSQFKDFDATSSKRGMWGYLVLEKDNEMRLSDDGTLKAHYIFQAGDHIGGTIDFVCHPDNRW